MRLLTLSTYPASRPLHGGQRRVDAIRRAAVGAGFAYLNLPVFFSESYPEADIRERLTALPDRLRGRLVAQGLREDLHLHRVVTDDLPAMAELARQVGAFRPDAVQLEHPWVFPLLERLRQRLPDLNSARLIYSAHNIEADLMPPRHRAETMALEKLVTAQADMVIAVSEADALRLRGWTDAHRFVPVVVAPNGCWPAGPAVGDGVRVVPEPYVLVAGSAHPPNAQGFWDSFGTVPGCIPPNGRLVVAGGVCALLRADPRFERFRRLNDAVVRYMGVVGDDTLANLLHHARAICLPITGGGGTNLKTAEALVSLKPIVARPAAFRGFEDARVLPGVQIEPGAPGFRHAVRRMFSADLPPARRSEDVARYTWPATLAGLGRAYRDMHGLTGSARSEIVK